MNPEDLFWIGVQHCDTCDQQAVCLNVRGPDGCALCLECINKAFNKHQANQSSQATISLEGM